MSPTKTAPQAERKMRSDAVRNHGKVVAAARKVMAAQGLDAQMEEIARRAKVGVGTVYRHFPTKDDLIEAMAHDRFARLNELAEEALEHPDAWEGFEQFMRRAAEVQVADQALSEVLVSRPGVMQRAAEASGILGHVTELIARAQKAGALRADAEPEDVPMVMCALAGTFKNPLSDPERYIGLIIDGMRAPGTTPLRPRG